MKPKDPKLVTSWTLIIPIPTLSLKHTSWHKKIFHTTWHKKSLRNRLRPTSLPWPNSKRIWRNWSKWCRVFIDKTFPEEWIPVVILAQPVHCPAPCHDSRKFPEWLRIAPGFVSSDEIYPVLTKCLEFIFCLAKLLWQLHRNSPFDFFWVLCNTVRVDSRIICVPW